jgi:hypothetical protein
MLSKIKKFLGTLTDLLLIGRNRGWWQKGQGPDFSSEPLRPSGPKKAKR